MARGVNKVILIGNVGSIETRFTGAGAAITNISLATSESWKDSNTRQRQEKTEWHRIVIFGKLAEIAQQYVQKGSKLYIEGKLQTRKWQAQDGQDRYSTEIIVDGFSGQMQMLDGRQDEGQQQPQQQYQPQQNGYQQARNNPQPQQQQSQGGGFDDFDDDIPFMRHMANMEYLV